MTGARRLRGKVPLDDDTPKSNEARALGPRGSRSELGTSDPAGELSPTAAAVLAAIPAWWATQAAAAGLSGSWLDVAQAISIEPPVQVGTDALLEETWHRLSPYEVGSAYVSSLEGGVRARHGRHYTPEALATRLWLLSRGALGRGRAPQALHGLVRDPACGAGALLLPALREHLLGSRGVDPRLFLAGIGSHIEGIDSDPSAVWICNVVLASQLLPVLAQIPERRRQPLPALARVGDGLEGGGAPADVVLMNPPYGRVKLSPTERERFDTVLYGHANLYALFMAAGLEGVADCGVLGALVPTSFTSGRYFSNLRSVLSTEARLKEIEFVADRAGVFGGVLQETCLAAFTKRKSQRTTVSTIIDGQPRNVASVKGVKGSTPWIIPRRSDDAPVAAAASTMTVTLKDTGWQVSTGPLVWNRRKSDLSEKQRPQSVHVIWAADLDGGSLHRDSSRDSLRYLNLRGPQDQKTLTLDEPAVLVQRTTAPEQRRRLVAAALTQRDLERLGGRVVVENHVNVLRPSTLTPLLSRETLLRVLATQTFDRLVRCMSGSVGISAFELESLPMPSPEILATWEASEAEDLERAVASAYLTTP